MATKARICESLWSGLLDDSGHPMSGGKVWTYESGTTTPKDMWLDRDKTTLATNPIVLDTFGRAEVYGDGLYKFVVMDPDDVELYDVDEIELIASGGNYTIDTLQIGDTTVIDSILDEDNFASNSATAVPTQQSTKVYVDTQDAAAKAALPDVYNFYVKYPYVDANTAQEQIIARSGSITSIKAMLGTDATGAAFILDVVNNGSVVKKLGDTYTFADITNTLTTKTDADTAIAMTAGQILAIRVNQVGSTVVGQDLKIQVIVARS